MSRIRTIKPEFPQSETVGKLSRDARLLFIQLWTVADDHGRSRGSPRLLASLLFPYDGDAIELMPEWLDELNAKGCIRLYEVDGDKYLDIPNWGKHQRIDNAGKSKIPEFRREPPRETATVGDPPLDLGPSTIGPSTINCAVAKATRTDREDAFEEFWKVYPGRKGANPKEPARKLFLSALKQGAVASEIVAAARRCASADSDKIGTEYIPQAVKWLRDKRWLDYPETGPPTPAPKFEPPPGARPLDEILAKFNGKSDATECATQVRSDTGLGQNGADHAEKLQLSSRGALCGAEPETARRAPDD